tara:strand:- start:436 stop:1380 length:945 start_codon:yes stop_codon:yes gene_type:complete
MKKKAVKRKASKNKKKAIKKKIKKVSLMQGRDALLPYVGMPFGEWMSPAVLETMFKEKNKGRGGLFIEVAQGLDITTTTLDYTDGECKENACVVLKDGTVRSDEHMSVQMMKEYIVDFIEKTGSEASFETCGILKKLRKVLMVFLVRPKKKEPATWWIHNIVIYDYDRSNEEDKLFYSNLKEGWEAAQQEYRERIKNGIPARNKRAKSAGGIKYFKGDVTVVPINHEKPEYRGLPCLTSGIYNEAFILRGKGDETLVDLPCFYEGELTGGKRVCVRQNSPSGGVHQHWLTKHAVNRFEPDVATLRAANRGVINE